ncbi:MAG: hypothetical protein Q4E21_07790 [Clostridia bacterium]|nr:hypothetical protein [Clostridia bacterium]
MFRHYGHSERPSGKLGEIALFSLKDTVRTQKDLLEENRQLRKTVELLKQVFKLTAEHKLNVQSGDGSLIVMQ